MKCGESVFLYTADLLATQLEDPKEQQKAIQLGTSGVANADETVPKTTPNRFLELKL